VSCGLIGEQQPRPGVGQFSRPARRRGHVRQPDRSHALVGEPPPQLAAVDAPLDPAALHEPVRLDQEVRLVDRCSHRRVVLGVAHSDEVAEQFSAANG
jgi:hypothetical protein